MHASNRFAPPRALVTVFSATIALAGCPAPSGFDAGTEELPPPADRVLDTQRPDRVAFDDTGDAIVTPTDTGVEMDAARDGSVDGDSGSPPFDAPNDTTAMMSLDVLAPDVFLPPQTCSWVSPPVVFGAMGSGSRAVNVRSDFTGFSASAAILRDGADNVWVQRVNRDGAPTLVGNATGAAAGSMVRGGSFVRESMFFLLAWSQGAAGSEQTFVQRTQDNFAPVAGSRVQLSTTGSNRAPLIGELRRGHLVAWETTSAGRSSVSVASVDLGTPGTIATPTATADVRAFDLVTSPAADVYALAYIDRSSNELRLTRLSATGAAMGAPIVVASGADLGDTVDAVIEDDGDVWVTWAQPASAGAARLRRVALAMTPAADPTLMVPMSVGATQPAIALDGADLAIAFRNPSAPNTIDLVRVRVDGALRDHSRLGGAAPGGAIGLEARDGRYGVGWSDDSASGALTRIAVASCR